MLLIHIKPIVETYCVEQNDMCSFLKQNTKKTLGLVNTIFATRQQNNPKSATEPNDFSWCTAFS